MKRVLIIILLAAPVLYGQSSITIETNASIEVGSGADLCGDSKTVNGQLTGGGSWCDGPLPVEIEMISSAVSGYNVTIKWKTAFELNNRGFEIMRSEKNISTGYRKIAFVEGRGTTNIPQDYSYTDRKLQTGRYYYRILQYDFNGSFNIFDMTGYAEVEIPKRFELSQNYPNPFNPITKIDFALPVEGKVSLRVYDVSGREAASVLNNESLSADFHTVLFDASMLSSGTYFYRIEAGAFRMTKKMVVVK